MVSGGWVGRSLVSGSVGRWSVVLIKIVDFLKLESFQVDISRGLPRFVSRCNHLIIKFA